MKSDFETKFTGWSFLVAAAMLWGGWLLIPRRLGTYLVPEDFPLIFERVWFWIWMYRIHMFGMVLTGFALIALAALLSDRPYRVMVWPGVGVAAVGTFVLTLATAFYFHHGAWGSGQTHGQSPEEVQQFIAALLVDTEYVTCLVRFGRVFSGLGLLFVGLALMIWKLLPMWVGGLAAMIGVAAMAITMGIPGDLQIYMPIFHIKAFWLAAMGAVLLRQGLRIPT